MVEEVLRQQADLSVALEVVRQFRKGKPGLDKATKNDMLSETMSAVEVIANQGLSSDNHSLFVKSAETIIELGCGVQPGARAFVLPRSFRSVGRRALSSAADNLDCLVAQITEGKNDEFSRRRQSLSVSIINLLATKKIDPLIKEKAGEMYQQLKSLLIRGVLTGIFEFDAGLEIYLKNNPRGFEQVLKEVKDSYQHLPIEMRKPLFRAFIISPSRRSNRWGHELAKLQLQWAGLTLEETRKMIGNWRRHLGLEQSFFKKDAIAGNLSAIAELEQKQPGAYLWLFKNYGIIHPDRYPSEMLLDQYRHRDDVDSPYGVVVYPYDDWNRAFYKDMFVFNDLSEQLGEISKSSGVDYRVRIMECRNLMGVARRLFSINRKYGKASFAVVAGHGTPDSISFGGGAQEGNVLTLEQVKKGTGVIRAISKFFVPEVPMVLFSCSTGVDSGIGQAISESGAAVIGPSNNTSPGRLIVNLRDGKLTLGAIYRDGKGQQFKGGSKGEKAVKGLDL